MGGDEHQQGFGDQFVHGNLCILFHFLQIADDVGAKVERTRGWPKFLGRVFLGHLKTMINKFLRGDKRKDSAAPPAMLS